MVSSSANAAPSGGNEDCAYAHVLRVDWQLAVESSSMDRMTFADFFNRFQGV